MPEPEETGLSFIANAELKALVQKDPDFRRSQMTRSRGADVGRRSRHLFSTLGRPQQKFPVGYAKG